MAAICAAGCDGDGWAVAIVCALVLLASASALFLGDPGVAVFAAAVSSNG